MKTPLSERILRILVLVALMLFVGYASCYAAENTKENPQIVIQYGQQNATTQPELDKASDEINVQFKQDKKKALMGVGVAALAVGAVYVGSHNWHDLQDKVGVDRVAHFGVSYIICDQLQRNFGMNKFWAYTTTVAIGAGKEKWVDNKWDGGDFAADCAGAMLALVDIRF